MAKFVGCYLTNAGLQICSSQGTEKIVFTKAATGSGIYSSAKEVRELEELKDTKQTFPLEKIDVDQEAHEANVIFYIENDAPTGYKLTEIGLYAMDQSQKEVLYCVAFTLPEDAEYVEAAQKSIKYKTKVIMKTMISDQAEVTYEYSKDREWFVEYIWNHVTNPKLISDGFNKTFTYMGDDQPEPTDPTAMTMDDVTNAINREWDGSSSQDETAMSTDEISNALETPWDGSSSTDPEAMSREEIEIAIQNGEMI